MSKHAAQSRQTVRLKALGYSHVRFFGGTTFEYDGSFRERVCELAMPGSLNAEFFVYG